MPITRKPISSMSYEEIAHEIALAEYQVEAAITHNDYPHERWWAARLERLLAARDKLEEAED